jgi:hypothetical protein
MKGDAKYLDLDEGAKYVFIGKPTLKNGFLSLKGSKYTFKPELILKGEPTESISVWSSKFYLPCGQQFRNDITYVVYAYENEGILGTSRCASWEAETYEKSIAKSIEFYSKKKSS